MDIAAILSSNLTAPAILGVLVLGLFTGLIYVRPVVVDLRNQRDKWHAAYEKERARREEDGRQLATLISYTAANAERDEQQAEQTRVIISMLESIRDEPIRSRQ